MMTIFFQFLSFISLIAEEGKDGGLWIEDDDDNDDDDVDDNDHEERRVYRAMQTKCELNTPKLRETNKHEYYRRTKQLS